MNSVTLLPVTDTKANGSIVNVSYYTER
jgi:hypothetical protein